jgi:HEPN domain-containing protein
MANDDQQRWLNFCMLGDQFIGSYLRLDSRTMPATLFNVGHALELYLKAVLLKGGTTKRELFMKSHDIGAMLEEVNQTRGLLKDFQLNPVVYTKYVGGRLIPIREVTDAYGNPNEPLYIDYVQKQELYWVGKYLQDLKYLGTFHKDLPNTYSILCMPGNPFWAEIFKELRKFLGWPTESLRYSGFDLLSSEYQYWPEGSNQRRFLDVVMSP